MFEGGKDTKLKCQKRWWNEWDVYRKEMHKNGFSWVQSEEDIKMRSNVLTMCLLYLIYIGIMRVREWQKKNTEMWVRDLHKKNKKHWLGPCPG